MAVKTVEDEIYNDCLEQAVIWGKSCGYDDDSHQVRCRANDDYLTMITPLKPSEVPSHVLDEKLDKIIELLSITT